MAVVHFDDRDYDFDIEGMTLAQARSIKRQTGLSVRGLLNGLSEMDPEALGSLYWLMLNQNGITTDISKVNFKVLAFGEALSAAFPADDEGEENPTAQAQDAPAPTT